MLIIFKLAGKFGHKSISSSRNSSNSNSNSKTRLDDFEASSRRRFGYCNSGD